MQKAAVIFHSDTVRQTKLQEVNGKTSLPCAPPGLLQPLGAANSRAGLWVPLAAHSKPCTIPQISQCKALSKPNKRVLGLLENM